MRRHQDSTRSYCSYLLRCWQEQGLRGTEQRTWRFRLHDPLTSTQGGFATFEALVAFPHTQLLDEPLAVYSEPSGKETG